MKLAGGKEESIRELIARLIDETKAYAKAEIAVVKAMAFGWIRPAKIAVPLVVFAVLLVQASLTILVAALGVALARWLGMAGGLAVSAVIMLLLAGGLVGIAVAKFSKASNE